MALYLLRERPTSQQVTEMLADLKIMMKVIVDLRREIMTGRGLARISSCARWKKPGDIVIPMMTESIQFADVN